MMVGSLTMKGLSDSRISPWNLIEGGTANAPAPLVGEGFSSWRGTSLEEKGEGPVPGRRGQVPHPVSLGSFLAKRNRPLPIGRGGRRVSECAKFLGEMCAFDSPSWWRGRSRHG